LAVGVFSEMMIPEFVVALHAGTEVAMQITKQSLANVRFPAIEQLVPLKIAPP
jgi:hypothetical protein